MINKAFYLSKKNSFPAFFFLLLFTLYHPNYVIAETSILNLNLQESMIELKAEKVLLVDILKAISEQARISIEPGDLMDEVFSGEFKGPLGECIRRILKNRNYVMIYKDTGGGQLVLSEVYVVTSRTIIKGNEPMSSLEEPTRLEDSTKKYTKQWLEREFGNGKKLASEISAGPSGKGIDDSGILITKIEENSFFQKIGLGAGDTIYDINGNTIYTLQEFIKILQFASKTEPMIRIERSKADNSNAPIYMELH